MNEFLLFKDNLYERLDIVSFIIVRGIANEKIVDKRIHLFIYVIEVDKIVLKARFYVTKGIKVDIILGNDVLEVFLNKINLHLHSKQMQIGRI